LDITWQRTTANEAVSPPACLRNSLAYEMKSALILASAIALAVAQPSPPSIEDKKRDLGYEPKERKLSEFKVNDDQVIAISRQKTEEKKQEVSFMFTVK
jgi:hypothetical protein